MRNTAKNLGSGSDKCQHDGEKKASLKIVRSRRQARA